MERNKINWLEAAYWSVFILCGTMLVEGRLFGQNLAPVLPLNADTRSTVFLPHLLADPYVSMPVGEQAADNLIDEIRVLNDESQVAKGSIKMDLQRKIFESYAALCLYLADAAEENQSLKKRGQDCSQKLISHAKSLRQSSKAPAEIDRLDFNLFSQGYLLGHSGVAVKGLKQLAEKKKIDRKLSQKINLVLAMHESLHAPKSKSMQAASKVISLSKGHGDQVLTGALALSLRLAAAHKLQNIVKASGNQLNKNMAQLQPKDQERVMNHMIRSWQILEGNGMQWDKAPFSLAGMQTLPQLAAVKERQALSLVKRSKTSEAIAIYENLNAEAYQSPHAKALAQRTLELYEIDYQKSGNPLRFEAKLLSSMTENPEDAGYKAKYQALVTKELSIGKNPTTAKARRQLSIQVASKYARQADDESQQRTASDIATMYSLNAEYAAAVAIYLELASQSKDKNAAYRFTVLAAQDQHKLAHVSMTPDFYRTLPAGEDSQRLLQIYQNLHQQNPTQWQHAAMLALLMNSQNQPNEAATLLVKQIQTSPQDALASPAAGFVLRQYQAQLRWDDTVALLKLCLDKNVSPRGKSGVMNVHQLLADALYMGGKHHFANQNHKKAKEFLQEFTTKYQSDSRRADGLYHLAQSAHAIKDYNLALKSCNEVVDNYPGAKEYKPSLLFGGDLAQRMAMEEYTIKYYSTFVAKFPQDDQFRNVNNELLEVYLGKQLFAEAKYMHELRLKSKQYTSAEKSLSLEKMMMIEHEHGNGKLAKSHAEQLLKQPDVSDATKAWAIAVVARESISDLKDFGPLVPYLKLVEEKLDNGDAAVADVRSELLFYRAELTWSGADEEIFNLELRDPAKKIEQIATKFGAMKAYYSAPCFQTSASHCAPAQFQLARRAEKILTNTEEVSIAETLSNQETARFQSLKDTLIADVTKTMTESDSRSLSLAQQGGITPEWTSMILWNNHADYLETSDATNFGYVQWDVK